MKTPSSNNKALSLATKIATLSAGTVSALIPFSANASIIRVDGLAQAINGTVNIDINGNGSNALVLNNQYSYAGTDYWGSSFYNSSVSASAAGVGTSPVVQGTLIGPGTTLNAGSATLDSTTANFYSTQVGTGAYTSCNKWGCYISGYYPIYGNTASYGIADNAIGNNLLVAFSFLSGSQTNFGWLDLNINTLGAGNPYNVVLNGYGYDNTGNAVTAGAAATVPEPATLLLLAMGAIGLYRRKHQSALQG